MAGDVGRLGEEMATCANEVQTLFALEEKRSEDDENRKE